MAAVALLLGATAETVVTAVTAEMIVDVATTTMAAMTTMVAKATVVAPRLPVVARLPGNNLLPHRSPRIPATEPTLPTALLLAWALLPVFPVAMPWAHLPDCRAISVL